MKEYHNPISLTSQFYFCPVPLRLDTYSGCDHGCVYCFANAHSTKNINGTAHIKRALPREITEYFNVAFEGKKNTYHAQEAAAIECIQRRVPLHFGGMSDPFQSSEERALVTLHTLTLLNKYSYPTIISTKGRLLTQERYLSLIRGRPHYSIQISLIDDRPDIIKILEPNAATIEERLHILRELRDNHTSLRIQPVIPTLTEDRIPHLVTLAKEVGVNHIMTEGLKFNIGNARSIDHINRAIKAATGKPGDLVAYYRAIGSRPNGSDLELPTWYKYQYAKKAKALIESLGMSYGSADNDLRFLSSPSVDPCCCGVSGLPGYQSQLRHNTGEAVRRAREQKKPYVTRELIAEEWMPCSGMRIVASAEKILTKYGKPISERPIRELFEETWASGGKNSPAQQSCVEIDPKGYRLLSEEEIDQKLKQRRYHQQTL